MRKQFYAAMLAGMALCLFLPDRSSAQSVTPAIQLGAVLKTETADGKTTHKVELAWQLTPSNENVPYLYSVERSEGNSGVYMVVYSQMGKRAWIDRGVVSGKVYTYRIKIANMAAVSNTANISIPQNN